MVGRDDVQFTSAGQGNGPNACRTRCRESPQYVFRRARRRQADHDVADGSECFHLSGKDVCVAEIVCDAGYETRTCRQADSRQRPTCELEPADQFADEMIRLRCAPPVSERKNLSSTEHAVDQYLGGRFDLLAQTIAAKPNGLDMRIELCENDFDQVTQSSIRLMCGIAAMSAATSPRRAPSAQGTTWTAATA